MLFLGIDCSGCGEFEAGLQPPWAALTPPASGRATYVTAEDVSLIEGGAVAIDAGDEGVTVALFSQHGGAPLSGKGDQPEPVLKKGTGLVVLKSQMRTTNIRAYLCDFVRVADGEHKGAEGWLVDTYVPAEPLAGRPRPPQTSRSRMSSGRGPNLVGRGDQYSSGSRIVVLSRRPSSSAASVITQIRRPRAVA